MVQNSIRKLTPLASFRLALTEILSTENVQNKFHADCLRIQERLGEVMFDHPGADILSVSSGRWLELWQWFPLAEGGLLRLQRNVVKDGDVV